jgi:hypothetical protein
VTSGAISAAVVSIVWPFVHGAARQFMKRGGERAGDIAFEMVQKLFSSGDDIDVKKTPPEQVLRAARVILASVPVDQLREGLNSSTVAAQKELELLNIPPRRAKRIALDLAAKLLNYAKIV